MAKSKKDITKTPTKVIRPALTPEAREAQLVHLAVDLAEKQLREGTASSQVITHYLKLGSSHEKLEQELLRTQIELDKAKTKNQQSYEEIKNLYTNALEAMREYSGQGESDNGG